MVLLIESSIMSERFRKKVIYAQGKRVREQLSNNDLISEAKFTKDGCKYSRKKILDLL